MELADNQQAFTSRDAEIIALASQDVNGAISTLSEAKARGKTISFPILADVDARVAKSYHVFGLKPNPNEGEPDIDSNFPSVFIIRSDHTIVWRYVGKSDLDRPKIEQIISQLP